MSKYRGVDRAKSFSSEELAELKKNGYGFVCRYLSKSAWKRLTKSEALKISKSGLYVVVVYQDSNNSVDKFTNEIGIGQASEAIKQAKAIGIPKGSPIYFSVDFDATTAKDYNAIMNYFNGVVSVMEESGYDIGVYGSFNVVTRVKANNKKVKYVWQTYAWSKGRVSEYSLYQYRNNVDAVDMSDKRLVDSKGKSLVAAVDLNYSDGAAGGWQIKE